MYVLRTYIVHYIEALIRLDVKCLPSSLGTSIVIPYAKGTTMNVWMYLCMCVTTHCWLWPLLT
ncbi:hypothetical protein K445DRAFT_204456 [Daldinia sp. EC12]|nr:hypothetical protein K445DRAFT_204456 [Daldinia sp. EC12]